MKRNTWLWTLVLLAVGGLIGLVVWRVREPAYHGRSLTRWLQRFDEDLTTDLPRRKSEASAAVRAIGAEKVVPRLLEMARAEDGRAWTWLMGQRNRWPLGRLKMISSAEDQWRLALYGFEILGTNGAPAMPELARLMLDTNHVFTALGCLINIGPPARDYVLQMLTNSNPDIRIGAVYGLNSVMEDPREFFARIKEFMTDTNVDVRVEAVRTAGARTNSPDSAVPLLISALSDTNADVAQAAAEKLMDFGTNALRAFPALSNIVESPDSPVAYDAMRTLPVIAPNETLPLILRLARSTNAPCRIRAIEAMCNYTVATAGIVEALNVARTDADAQVSAIATNSMRQLLSDQKQTESVVSFPNEPAYGGKSLGEWLKQRTNEYAFSTNAVMAFKRMGTNAIAALMRRLAYREPYFGLPDADIRFEAAVALMVMEENARPALPELERLMESNDPDEVRPALLATQGLMPEAFRFCLQGMTNQDTVVRIEALAFLNGNTDDHFRAKRGFAAPFLIELLQDPDESVRQNATNALAEIDPKAAKAAFKGINRR